MTMCEVTTIGTVSSRLHQNRRRNMAMWSWPWVPLAWWCTCVWSAWWSMGDLLLASYPIGVSAQGTLDRMWATVSDDPHMARNPWERPGRSSGVWAVADDALLAGLGA